MTSTDIALAKVQADLALLNADVAALAATLTPTPPPTPPPTALWTPDLSGGLKASDWAAQSFVAGHVTIVDDPKGGNFKCLRFAIDNTDHPYSGSPPRGDIYSSYQFAPGMDRWISIPMYTPPAGLPASILGSNGQWLLVSQLAIPGGNNFPQLAWSVASDPIRGGVADGKRHWNMSLRAPVNGPIWVGPEVDDKWHTLIVHIVTESKAGATDGSVELWYDGAKQTLYHGQQTLTGIRILEQGNDGVSYSARLGLDSYRQPNMIPGTYALYHGVPRIGTSMASV